MDWNYPGFTACLVSALVLSVVLLFGDCLEWCPFRGFHRSLPLLWQQHTGLCSSSACTSQGCSLGSLALQWLWELCPRAETPQSPWDPKTATAHCQLYEPPKIWLLPDARRALRVGNRTLRVSCTICALFLYSSLSSDRGFLVIKRQCWHHRSWEMLQPLQGTNSTVFREAEGINDIM